MRNKKVILKTYYAEQSPLYITKARACPSCGFESIFGMPGGRDAVCKNCGYKDSCCAE